MSWPEGLFTILMVIGLLTVIGGAAGIVMLIVRMVNG